jgi:hypothetical protein
VYRSNHILPAIVIPILAVVAILGYLIGAHRAPTTPAVISSSDHTEGTQVASAATVTFEYPTSWQRTASVPAVPGLQILHPFLLSPAGNAAQAGLLSGRLAGGEPSPLPRSFLAGVRGIPHTEVVSLTNVQAYRYSHLDIQGFSHVVNLYVVPNLGADATVVACYAAGGYAEYLHECEEIVTQLTLVGQAAAVLSPSTAYAGELGGVLAKLDAARVKLRGEIHARTSLAGVDSLATALASRFADVAATLHTLEPPLAAVGAQTVLAGAVVQARNAYTALAAAAASERSGSYASAERAVAAAERAVDAALENFLLLGYDQR